MTFVSNKENGTDLLVYISDLVDSKTGAAADSQPFTLPSRRPKDTAFLTG